MSRGRNVVKALAALENIEAVFRQSSGGTPSATARADAERWAYDLALSSDDAFCREKASFIVTYGEDYFSDSRHAKYGMGKAPGLSVLRDRIFATLAAIRERLNGMRLNKRADVSSLTES